MNELLEQNISPEEAPMFIRSEEDAIAQAIEAGEGNKDLARDVLEAARLATEMVELIVKNEI